jgi:hypothetical protein
MAMRAATVQPPIGTLAAIPFLLSMVAFGGSFYVARLTLRLVEQESAVRARAHETGQGRRALLVGARTTALRQDVARLRAEVAAGKQTLDATVANGATIAAVAADLERKEGLVAERQEALARREAERKTLADRLAELERRAEQAAAMRVSRSALEKELTTLSGEVVTAESKVLTVRREIDEKEKYPAKELVPRGTRRQAVFMEADAEGVWIMPERTLLEPSVPLLARATFLASARATGYVVFLVRPDGYKAFTAYRELLEEQNAKSSGIVEFGYEPVNADWKLAYPAAGEEKSR